MTYEAESPLIIYRAWPLWNRLIVKRYPIIIAILATLAGCSTFSEPETLHKSIKSFYNHDGTKIHFKDAGKGRPFILIHGFGASMDTWRYLEGALKSEYRLVFLDLKGHGYSDRPRDERYSLEDHAEVVMGLVEHLKLSNVVLVGHSLGSVIALFAALKTQKISTDKVSGIVLLAGSLDPENLPLFLRLLRFPIFGWLTMKLTTASFRTRLVLKKAFHDDEKVTDSLVELYSKYQRIPGTDYALLKTAEQMIPQDASWFEQELRGLDIPVLNIAGEHDEIISRVSAEQVCKVLPRCRLAVVEGVGHVPHEEAPQKVVSLLKDFITGFLKQKVPSTATATTISLPSP